jgi:hypothetical protein
MARPADIVSPIKGQMLPPKTSAEEGRRDLDHQIGLMAGVRDFPSLAEYKSNVVGLARTANRARRDAKQVGARPSLKDRLLLAA